MPFRVLFVCLGNICRSPLAEAAFRAEAERLGLDAEADSAGTGGWHAGEPPDRRAVAAARRNGVDISQLKARQVTIGDFERFAAISEITAEKLAEIEARIATLLAAPPEALHYAQVAALAHGIDDIVVSEIENWQAVFGSKQIAVPG